MNVGIKGQRHVSPPQLSLSFCEKSTTESNVILNFAHIQSALKGMNMQNQNLRINAFNYDANAIL